MAEGAGSPETRRGPIRALVFLEARRISGAAKPLLEFLRQASRPGAAPAVDPTVLTFMRGETSNDFTRAVNRTGCPLERVEERGAFDFRILPQLREIVERRRPEAIWTNNAKSHFLVRLAGLDRRAPWVAYHHGYTDEALRTRLYNQLDRWSLRAAVRVVTVCQPFAAQLASRGVKPDRIRVQHCPIGPAPGPLEPASAVRRRLGIAPDDRIVLCVGRLSREKGHAVLIRAAAWMRNRPGAPAFRVLLAGEGSEEGNLRTLAKRLGVEDALLLLGHRSDVHSLYAAADVAVLPSHTEGSPNVVLEALQTGVPVVATRVGGVPEMLRHRETGLLVSDGDHCGLAEAVLGVLEDRALGLRLIEAGRRSLERYSPELYYRNIATLLEEAANTRGRKASAKPV